MVAKVALLIGLAGLSAGFVYFKWREAHPDQAPALTADARAYTRSLALSEVQMKAAEAFAGQQVVEIVGKITNKGDRPLNSVEVTCVFYDAYGQIVLRERLAIVRTREGGLKPGEMKTFRLPFDNLPASWNQALPHLVIANIQFG